MAALDAGRGRDHRDRRGPAHHDMADRAQHRRPCDARAEGGRGHPQQHASDLAAAEHQRDGRIDQGYGLRHRNQGEEAGRRSCRPDRRWREPPMSDVSADTIQRMWIVTLAIYAVVLVVVAALLALILKAARDICAGVSMIWTVGQQVANNTIHIALLDTTNHVAGEILDCAKGVVATTAALKAHAESCPGCPVCVLGPGRPR